MEIKGERLCVGKCRSQVMENGCYLGALSFMGWGAGLPFLHGKAELLLSGSSHNMGTAHSFGRNQS